MSSGRDMVAVVGCDSLCNKRSTLWFALTCATGGCKGTVGSERDVSVGRFTQAKSSTTFWCCTPHFAAGPRVSPLALMPPLD
jgi:hypothetical protein